MANNLKDKASARYSEVREKAGAAAKTAKMKAEKTAASTKAGAKKAAKKTVDSVEANPLAALIGGLAVGAIAAALLPRTRREDELVGKVGKKIRATASTAAKNARQTAKDQLDTLGVNANAARGQIRDLANKIGQAAAEATSAATDTIKKR